MGDVEPFVVGKGGYGIGRVGIAFLGDYDYLEWGWIVLFEKATHERTQGLTAVPGNNDDAKPSEGG